MQIAFVITTILLALTLSGNCQTPEAPPPKAGWVPLATYDFNDGQIPSIFRAYGNGYNDLYGAANNQLEAQVPSQVNITNGKLQLWAHRRLLNINGNTRHFAGAFLGTRDNGVYFPAFSRFEFRARFDQAQGLWPAIWLRHRQGASTCEVDIFEEFHSQYAPGGASTLHIDGVTNKAHKVFHIDGNWHTHAVEITQVANGNVNFTFFLDDVVTLTFLDTSHQWVAKAPLNATWDLALNFAVGGKWTGDPDETQLGILHTTGTVTFDPVNTYKRTYSDPGKCAHGGTFPNCNTSGIVRASFPHKAEFGWFRVLVRA